MRLQCGALILVGGLTVPYVATTPAFHLAVYVWALVFGYWVASSGVEAGGLHMDLVLSWWLVA